MKSSSQVICGTQITGMVGEELKHHHGVVEGGREGAGQVILNGQPRTRRVGADLGKELVAVRLLLGRALAKRSFTFASR